MQGKWHVSLDVLACAICACIFKDEGVNVYKWVSVVHMMVCEVAIVLQSKSIKTVKGCCNWSKPKSYNRPYVLYHIPWILAVCNDSDAGTALD